MSRSWRKVSTSRAETPDFLFLSRLMTTAGKGLLTVRSFELTPMVKRTIGDQEIAGNLGQRFVAGFHQLNRFQFELFRKRSLSSFAWSFPFVEHVHFFKFTFSTFSGQDQEMTKVCQGKTLDERKNGGSEESR